MFSRAPGNIYYHFLFLVKVGNKRDDASICVFRLIIWAENSPWTEEHSLEIVSCIVIVWLIQSSSSHSARFEKSWRVFLFQRRTSKCTFVIVTANYTMPMWRTYKNLQPKPFLVTWRRHISFTLLQLLQLLKSSIIEADSSWYDWLYVFSLALNDRSWW